MKIKGYKVKLGFFILLALVLLAAAIYYMGRQRNLFGNSFRLKSMFKNVSGLRVGNNVRFSGINVGTVDRIAILTDTTIRVDMVIEEDVRKFIKQDATAIIGSEGLMGNKVVNIIPGTPQKSPVNNNDYIASAKPLDFDDILENLKVTSNYTAIISKEVSEIFTNINSGKGAVGVLLKDEKFASDLKNTLSNMDKAMQEIRNGANSFNENMEALQSTFLLKGQFKKKEKAKKAAQQAEEEAGESTIKQKTKKKK